MSFSIDDVRLLDDRVLVRRVDRGLDETAGGIAIPDQAHETGDAAEIVRVGPGRRSSEKLREIAEKVANDAARISDLRSVLNAPERSPITLEPGQQVIINRYAGTELKAGDEIYLVLRESDVLAVIEEPVGA